MSLTPAYLDLTLYRGTDFSAEITCQDDGGSPVDLTGYTFIANVRHAPTGYLIIDLAPAITNPSGGVITITLDATATLALAANAHVWDLFAENPAGARIGPYVAGKFIVQEPVSKFP